MLLPSMQKSLAIREVFWGGGDRIGLHCTVRQAAKIIVMGLLAPVLILICLSEKAPAYQSK